MSRKPSSTSDRYSSPAKNSAASPHTCTAADRPAVPADTPQPKDHAITIDLPLLQVLIVEDDFGDLALMENAFADHPVRSTLHHVADGADALAFLRREHPYRAAPRPDLILLDLNMPRVDGRQALTEIKTDQDLKLIPTIVFTTSAAHSDIISSYGAHANAYVTKPNNLDDYDRVVAEIRNFYGHTAALPRRTSDEAA